MPLQPQKLGVALDQPLKLHSALCRREAPTFQKAVRTNEDVVVACTQEKQLFAELAQQTPGASSVIKFVNIRETGGWSKDAASSMPKLAALLAAAQLPDAEPVATVTYKSTGRLLIVGALDQAEQVAALVADALDVTLFARGASAVPAPGFPAQERRYPVISGEHLEVDGWLGAFKARWTTSNAIDLDLCTRCNACVAACPEGAIDLSYQVVGSKCTSHRDCVAVCKVAGAIDFNRQPASHSESFDMILDLGVNPLIALHAPPQGYFAVDVSKGLVSLGLLPAVMQLRELVGEFEKPKFFNYKQKICAHSRNETVGCKACVDICSAGAISSDKSRQQIVVNPNLCVGCGACTTVCPSGALTYAYPRASEQGVKLKTMLSAYAKAGGQHAAVLLHSEKAGREWVELLGRSARLSKATHGVPSNVIPLALWHTASTGIDLWLSAIVYGAQQVLVLVTDEEAPQYLTGIQQQMQVAQSILNGLGYVGTHLHVVQAPSSPNAAALANLDEQLLTISLSRPGVPAVAGRFAVAQEKRSTLDMALDHLISHAPVKDQDEVALPAVGSPFGSLLVNKDDCTLCLSCVSACPASALQDNPERPQLKFIEKNCVQCGLCASTCPEDAITLKPRLLLTAQRKEARVLNESQPFHCVRCSKPFGTLRGIEAMLGKLAGHAMFQGAAADRLKMCGDCRVVDIYSSKTELQITDIR